MGSIFSKRELTAVEQEIEDARTREFGKIPETCTMSIDTTKVSKEFKQYTRNMEATLESREGRGCVESKQDLKANLLRQGFSEEDAERIATESFPNQQ